MSARLPAGDVFNGGGDLFVLPCTPDGYGYIPFDLRDRLRAYDVPREPDTLAIGEIDVRFVSQYKRLIALFGIRNRPIPFRYVAFVGVDWRPKTMKTIGNHLGRLTQDDHTIRRIIWPWSGPRSSDPVALGALVAGFTEVGHPEAHLVVAAADLPDAEELSAAPTGEEDFSRVADTERSPGAVGVQVFADDGTYLRGDGPVMQKVEHRNPVPRNLPRSGGRDRVFVSYSRKDQRWLHRLQVHLDPLERAGLISRWDDTLIKPGANWRDEIKAAVDSAKVAVLLISADFLASDFIRENELPPLLAAAEDQGAVILPVIVSPCRFLNEPGLSRFQAVNDPAKALVGMSRANREKILVRVTELVELALKS